MFLAIEGTLAVSVSGILAGGLAFGISEENRIVIRNVRCRQTIVFAFQDKACFCAHKAIELATSHFVFAHVEIVIEFGLHLRTFSRFRIFVVRAKRNFGVRCRNR